MDKKRGDNCQESGVPGVTAEKPQTVLIHYYRGYLNIIEVVGFLFRLDIVSSCFNVLVHYSACVMLVHCMHDL